MAVGLLKSTLLITQVLFTFSRQSVSASYQHVIYLDAQRGSDNSSCWNGTLPCCTLNFALEGAQVVGNSTEILIAPGNYKLHTDVNRNVTKFQSVARFAIIGNVTAPGEPEVDVSCEQGAGFTFINSREIEFKNIRFTGCGVEHTSTSRNFANSQQLQFLQFFSAFYFLFCKDVHLNQVTISHSHGIAVQLYATVGDVTFKDCDLSFNSVSTSEIAGGGGLYIEFPYCAPGDQNCGTGASNISREFSENARYAIENCTLAGNVAHVNEISNVSFAPFIPHARDHWAFGRGGGLSVFFKGSARNINIVVEDCHISNNTALWGAGVFVEFQDNTSRSEFVLRRSHVEDNRCYSDVSFHEGTGGGGLRLGYIFYNDSRGQSSYVHHNRIELESCDFTRNKAYWGGGVSFYAARETETISATNALEFVDCHWSYNEAILGSAVDLSLWHPVTEGAKVTASFVNCTFSSNNRTYSRDLDGKVGIGTFFSDSIPVCFHGYINFTSNEQSALVATSTSLDFMDDCIAYFVNNTGRNGGALSLSGYAFVRVHNNTEMCFTNNSAQFQGGAIYSESVGQHDILASLNCFLRFSDIDATPWNWTSRFYFEQNWANHGSNSIYVTSLLPCLFGGSYGPSTGSEQSYIDKVFCWTDNWSYGDGNCTDEITTAPANYNSNSYKVCVHSGKLKKLPVEVLNDYKQVVKEPQVLGLQAPSDNLISANPYVTNDYVMLFKTPGGNSSANFSLETLGPRIVRTEVFVEFLPCPPGFLEKNRDKGTVCECGGSYAGLVECSMSTFNFTSKLQLGAWMGTVDDSSVMVAGFHPYSKGSLFSEYFPLPNCPSKLESTVCHPVNRKGVLCGDCNEGYAPGFNIATFACVPCSTTDSYYYWVFYILAKLVPLTVLLFLTLVFRVSVTSGPANSFVFFAQILVASFTLGGWNVQSVHFWEVRSASDFFRAIYVTIYGIANLNFFEPLIPGLCVGQVGSLHVIALVYIVAAYPLVFLLVIYLFVSLYDRGWRPIVCLCRPVHRCFAVVRRTWDLRSSLIHCFTTMIVVSYTKFILASFFFLIPAHLYDDTGAIVGEGRLYFNGNVVFLSGEHIPYFVAALCVMVVFVCFLPLLLLVYPLKLVEKLTESCDRIGRSPWKPGPKLLQLLDAFQGCYRDQHRYFAGLYLIFRIAIFVISLSTTPQWFLQFFLLQVVFMIAIILFSVIRPYKVELYNNVDTVIFAILAVITTLTFYVNYESTISKHTPRTWPLVFLFILIYLPLVYMVSYVVYTQLISRSRRCLKFFSKVYSKIQSCCLSEEDIHSLRLVGNEPTSYSSITMDSSVGEMDLSELSVRMREQSPYHPLTVKDTY